MKNKIKKIIAGAAIALTSIIPSKSEAASFFEGMKGPEGTNYQIDTRLGISKGKDRDETYGKVIFKVWPDESNFWGFAAIQYQKIKSEGENEGIGDITVGAGPRFKIGETHFLGYGAVTLPTGDQGYKRPEKDYDLGTFLKDLKTGIEEKSALNTLIDYAKKESEYESLPENKPAIGSGETKLSFGLAATRLYGKWGINGAVDYTVGLKSDTQALSGGLFLDRALGDSFRIGAGLDIALPLPGGEESYTANLAGRWTSKNEKWFVDLTARSSLETETKSLEFSVKYNF